MGVDVGSIGLDGLRIDEKNESERREKQVIQLTIEGSGCGDWCTDIARGRGGTTAIKLSQTPQKRLLRHVAAAQALWFRLE